MSYLQQYWYKPGWYKNVVGWLLAPLTGFFWLVSASRRQLYRVGFLKSARLPVPVIVVGNITVGGNGKTPLVVLLAQWLRQEGLHPGVLSRGYGGKSDAYPIVVNPDSDASEVGDEPVLMRQHIGCPLVVDPNRPRGGRKLVDQLKCNVIICDDGLQHYALQRDIEIVVLDGERRLGNRCLLPMGPLREGQWRLNHADFVVTNGGAVASGEFLMTLEAGHLRNVKYANKSKSISDLHSAVVAAAGIGNPQRFFNLLRSKQVKLEACLAFPDHHQFSAEDLPQKTVLMTEKDAVKCRGFAHDDWWYLPVSARISEQFRQQLLSKLTSIKKKMR